MKTKDEIFNEISNGCSITRPQIILAKEFILKKAKDNEEQNIKTLIKLFINSVHAESNDEVVIHSSVDIDSNISEITQKINWELAFSEAIWSLIHANLVVLLDSTIYDRTPRIKWTTVVPGSGGSSGSWTLQKLTYSLPNRVKISPSLTNLDNSIFVDPDLFLEELDIENIQDEVEFALIDAIRCFRSDLYLPTLVMLTKATEGAWIQLGVSLKNFLTESQQKQVKKQIDNILDEYSSFSKIVNSVIDLYKRQDFFHRISDLSEISLQNLKAESIWVDCLRDSRNVVHYGVEANLPNSYEKVATIILRVPKHFRLIYKLIETTESTK